MKLPGRIARISSSVIAAGAIALLSTVSAGGLAAQASSTGPAAPLVVFSHNGTVLSAESLPAAGDGVDLTVSMKETCAGGYFAPGVALVPTLQGNLLTAPVNGAMSPVEPFLMPCKAPKTPFQGSHHAIASGYWDVLISNGMICLTRNGAVAGCWWLSNVFASADAANPNLETHTFLLGGNTVARAWVVRKGKQHKSQQTLKVPKNANEVEFFPGGQYIASMGGDAKGAGSGKATMGSFLRNIQTRTGHLIKFEDERVVPGQNGLDVSWAGTPHCVSKSYDKASPKLMLAMSHGAHGMMMVAPPVALPCLASTGPVRGAAHGAVRKAAAIYWDVVITFNPFNVRFTWGINVLSSAFMTSTTADAVSLYAYNTTFAQTAQVVPGSATTSSPQALPAGVNQADISSVVGPAG